ncbi:MAG TPA: M61 family peptidase [Deltaproteobacteria bacterium]|nr:M61 family peptidase [Deltaproteobacteria bacterium]
MIVAMLSACVAEPEIELPAPDPRPLVDPGDAIASYVLRFPEVQAHRIQIEATSRCPAGGTLQWWMATWTPGSYLVREFARNLEQIEALSPGGAQPITKIAKNRWQVRCVPGEASGVRYVLYARELSVRTSFVDDELGVINGAATFLFPDRATGPLDVRLELPQPWSRSETALQPHPDGSPHHYLAPDVDTLIDSPLVLGNPEVRIFDVDEIPHHLVTLGQPGPWDHDRAVADVERITQGVVDFWGEIPYPEYWFLNVLGEISGGLEHRESTLMMTSRWNTSRRAERLRWLGLVSHELFHTWNVKRLRPEALSHLDYEREVYTPSLWIAEGITSYYDDLLLARAGLMTEAEYLERLSSNIADVQRRPGRRIQPLSAASFDAWIKHYRRDENTVNSSVSYYTKGAVVAWLLDAKIRRATQDRHSLDDLMRLARSRTLDEGYSPERFRALASEIAETPLDPFFASAVDSTDELDFADALQWWGLRFHPPGTETSGGWLGASIDPELVVTEVLRDSPAWHAGLTVGDELLALDDERLTSGLLETRLDQLGAGHEGLLLVSRRGHLRRLSLTLGAVPTRSWSVQPDPGASPIADRRRRAWLSP